ncbi:SDR family NAD(P)-dependent oxidoreductase [Candidatus Poriferisocius sp.]|uniref:SDR family NAD(P)-dependent oxidoreductase n=1 Tax=Candidatus Poriferisocius sp. TaxID=3101276 RepID=UPI003B5C943E
MEGLGVFDLSGRVACVTGAASGIGEAAAETLAAAGAAVVLGDIDGDGADRTRDRIVDGGGRAVSRVTDTTQSDQVSALLAAATDEFGRLDVMANVAGVGSYGDVVDVTEAELDRVLAINFKGVFFGCQAAMRVMGPQGSGSIINVSATAINTPVGGLSVYAATKAAVAMLTQSLAVEAGPIGVRVNTIAPGFTLTNFVGGHLRDAEGQVDPAEMDSYLKLMRDRSPLGEVCDASDQANLIWFLASDASRYVTGQILRANAGQSITW